MEYNISTETPAIESDREAKRIGKIADKPLLTIGTPRKNKVNGLVVVVMKIS